MQIIEYTGFNDELIVASHGWRKCGNFGWTIRGHFFWGCSSSTAIAILSRKQVASDIATHTNKMRPNHVKKKADDKDKLQTRIVPTRPPMEPSQ